MLTFDWLVDEPTLVKQFLKKKGISRRLLSRIKFHGGNIYVNERQAIATRQLSVGDHIRVVLPPEGKQEIIPPINQAIDILYEDDHYIAVNKPAGYTSIPSQYNPQGSMANILKAYYQRQDYANQVIHVVTRLDRDTSGIMLFAKHAFAHSLIDKVLQEKQIMKQYLAITDKLVSDHAHGFIEAPIGRSPHSIIERQVSAEGKPAMTEYELWKQDSRFNYYRVILHTGRTHQIRVHFAHCQAPLVGDDLYGGSLAYGIERQALHCRQISFVHPISEQKITIEAPLPQDLQELSQ